MLRKKSSNSSISRRDFLKLSAASAPVLLSSSLWPKASWATKGNILKIRDYGDWQSLDPAKYLWMTDENICRVVYNHLVRYKTGRKWELENEAAKSIRQVDPTHIEFELHSGIMFTHGYGEMTAEDVKYSFERIIDPAVDSPNKGDWDLLDKVEVTGKYTGTIVLKAPFQPVWWTTLPHASGNIISMKATEKVGGTFSTQPPCFSGPYMLKEWTPKQRTVLAANPDWKGPKPGFEEIHIFPVDDEKIAEMGFEAGDYDFTKISIPSIERYMANPPSGTKVEKYPSTYFVWLGLNMQNPKLTDIRVRKAIHMAVDIPSVLKAGYFGQAEIATGAVPKGLLGHREKTLIPPEADFAGAKKLLADAGKSDGLSLTLDVINKAEHTAMAQIIQANLAQVGIKIQINTHDSGAFWTLGNEKKRAEDANNIQLIMQRWSAVPDASYYTRWHLCDQIGIWNWERLCDKEYEDLEKKALTELDSKKRHEMYVRMQDIMEGSGCFRFLTNEVIPVIYRDWLDPACRPDGIQNLRYAKRM